MNIKTKIISCLFVIGIAISGFSQSKAITKKAAEITANMNSDLVGEGKLLALSESQISEITALQITRMEAMKKIRKEGGSADDKAAVNKACYQKLFKEILTQKQRLAMQEVKKKKKH